MLLFTSTALPPAERHGVICMYTYHRLALLVFHVTVQWPSYQFAYFLLSSLGSIIHDFF